MVSAVTPATPASSPIRSRRSMTLTVLMTTTLSLGPDSKVKHRLDVHLAAVLSISGRRGRRKPMTGARQVLFIQGGGAGTHDEWDDKLVDSLRRELGDGYEVRYPRMPAEDDPSYATCRPAIQQAIATLKDGATVVGRSVGASILIAAIVERPP